MKQINLHGMTCLEQMRGRTNSWYWATDYTSGDLYEAEELFRQGHPVHANRLLLIHYPDGTVYEPIPSEDNCYFGEPIFYEDDIYILSVDFSSQQILINAFSPMTKSVTVAQIIPLSEVEDCYNLLLHKSPLMLTRQASDDSFQIIWPEKVVFSIHPRESFLYRENDKLYFSMWHEDPDYREEIIVRSLQDGQMIEKYSGSMKEMPKGEWWHLK